MIEATSLPAGTEWWTACQTYTWVAFGEARKLVWWDDNGNERWEECIEFPRSEWSLDWKDHPHRGLSQAFVHMEEGRDWQPDEWDGRGKDHCLAWARAIIRDTKLGARRLNEMLTADIEQCIRNEDKLRQAFRDVMAAVRAGRLTVWARPTFKNGASDISAMHEQLNTSAVFLGPRAISTRGGVESTRGNSDFVTGRLSFEALFDDNGPRWDDAQFIAGQVQALWPAAAKVQPAILQWLTEAAETFKRDKGDRPKRDDLVRDCVAALKCRYEDAEAAHKMLPDHLRRRRGEKV